MCDVDHFKAYNDRFGHAAGDEVLRAVDATLVEQIREGDGVYRYGGEEFLLLAEQTLESGAVAGERLRRSVEGLGIAHPGASQHSVVTVSVGVAAFTEAAFTEDEKLGEAVLAAADAALYRAKASGRNTVCC